MLNAIVYWLSTGILWGDIPERFEPWQSVFGRFRAWMGTGIWKQVLLFLTEQENTRPKYRLLAAGGVTVTQRMSSTPYSVALPVTKRQYLGSEGVLHHRFEIL